MRLRILLTFLSLTFIVTACNNSKKHDNPGDYDLEQQLEANINGQQNILKKDIEKCGIINSPQTGNANCPALNTYKYSQKFDDDIPSCYGWGWTPDEWEQNKCGPKIFYPIDKSNKDDIEVAPFISLDVVMAYEVIPIEIKNKEACFMVNANRSFFSMMPWLGSYLSDSIDYRCEGFLLRHTAGNNSAQSGNKAFYGNIIVAPINPNGAAVNVIKNRLDLAFKIIGLNEAQPLQEVRYGSTSYNITSGYYKERYAHVYKLNIKDVRYNMRGLDLYDLRTNQPYVIQSAQSYFAFGEVFFKYGHDSKNYNLGHAGHLTPNFLTPEKVQNEILNQNQEAQELQERMK